MIALDTSALMAIILAEPEAAACREAVAAHDDFLIAGPTLTECLIVASRRSLEW